MNKDFNGEFYFKMLAAWAKGVSEIIRDNRLHLFTKEFQHDTKAHAAKLKDIAELLLLNKPTGAITEAAHSANTMLSEVPTSENDTHIGDVGAGSSETEIVKQNEQTKEVGRCKTCGWKYTADVCCKDCIDLKVEAN